MNKDKNLKDFNRLLIIGLIFISLIIVSCINTFITGNLDLYYIRFSFAVPAIGLMLYLNREYKKDFEKQLKEETEEFIIKI